MTPTRSHRPLVIGHRGARGLRPENTLPSIEAAIATGADMIEIDVQLTADGVPAVLHDPRLSPDLCRNDGRWIDPYGAPINEMAWSDLASYDAGMTRPGSDADKAFPCQADCGATRIPRLSEVLDLLANRGIGLLLEIKNDCPDEAYARGPDFLAKSVLREIGPEPLCRLYSSPLTGASSRQFVVGKRRLGSPP